MGKKVHAGFTDVKKFFLPALLVFQDHLILLQWIIEQQETSCSLIEISK